MNILLKYSLGKRRSVMDIANTRLPEYLSLRLEKAGLISAAQVQIALQDQIRYNHLELEEILTLRGWLKPETIDFFANKISKLIKHSQKITLIKCLKQAGLLTDEEIKNVIKAQKETGIVFDRLLVKLGYIKESTIDFFKNYLVGKNSDRISKRPVINPNLSRSKTQHNKDRNLKSANLDRVKQQEFFDPKTTSSLKISLPRKSFILSLRLNQAGLISESQIELAIQDRTQYSHLTLEEILILRGWLKTETIDFFLETFPKIMNQPKTFSLAECLEKAGLLTKEKIARILNYQKATGKDFYSLVTELTTIKQSTLDFFLNYLVDLPSEKTKSNSNPWCEAKTVIAASPTTSSCY